MKKFYFPIFTAVLLFCSFVSQGQTYNSITTNAGGLTFDDPLFWQGGTGAPPTTGCAGCTININADVIIPQDDGTSSTGILAGTNPALNYWILDNVVFNVNANANVRINTSIEFFGSNINIGSDLTSPATLFVNDQIFLDQSSTVVLSNANTVLNANNDDGNTVVGNWNWPTPFFKLWAVFTLRTLTGPPPSTVADETLAPLGLTGNYLNTTITPSVNPYTINCGQPAPPPTCANGIVFGPAATFYDATNDFYSFKSTAILPVVLVQFLASKNDDGSVKVIWATSQEQNSAYYDVERSSDQVGWDKIGTVRAKGFSSVTTNYSFTDKLPLDGTSYYRLKMVDLDGKLKYSKAVPINSDNNSKPLVIYNNPFSDQIRLKVNLSRAQNLTLTVSDMLGKTYIQQSYQAQSGDNFVNLQPKVGGSGMYILRIQGDSYDQTVKLEKQ